MRWRLLLRQMAKEPDVVHLRLTGPLNRSGAARHAGTPLAWTFVAVSASLMTLGLIINHMGMMACGGFVLMFFPLVTKYLGKTAGHDSTPAAPDPRPRIH